MTTRGPLTGEDIAALVTPRERVYFALIVIASLLLYWLLGMSLVAAAGGGVDGVGAAAGLLLYVPIIVVVYFLSHAYTVGRLRGNGVRVSARQFPELHRLVTQHAQYLGLAKVPPVYVVQAGGVLNAFVIKFFARQFVVLYSDVVALAQEHGAGALGFVVGHELGHIRRGHLRFRWLTLPGRLVPYLGSAYSRACEYTCDRIGAKCEPADAVAGLLVLAAGRSLYRQVDAATFAEQAETENSFWVRRAEVAASHPFLPKRVAALLEAMKVGPASPPPVA